MLVECTVQIGGARLIKIRQLASPVQSFLLKAEDFSLAFLSSSISTYRISRSQPYRVCQTSLPEGAAGKKPRARLRKSHALSPLSALKAPSPTPTRGSSLKSYFLPFFPLTFLATFSSFYRGKKNLLPYCSQCEKSKSEGGSERYFRTMKSSLRDVNCNVEIPKSG